MRLLGIRRIARANGIRWAQALTLEDSAQAAMRMMRERDAKTLTVSFRQSDEDFIAVYARGDRAAELRAAVDAFPASRSDAPAPGPGPEAEA